MASPPTCTKSRTVIFPHFVYVGRKPSVGTVVYFGLIRAPCTWCHRRIPGGKCRLLTWAMSIPSKKTRRKALGPILTGKQKRTQFGSIFSEGCAVSDLMKKMCLGLSERRISCSTFDVLIYDDIAKRNTSLKHRRKLTRVKACVTTCAPPRASLCHGVA